MVVNVGQGTGKIVSSSSERIEFVDDQGERSVITFPEFHLSPDQRQSRYIGRRKLDKPPWWVEIGGVRFVFATYEEAYSKLLGPLRKAGLQTYDLT